MDWLRRTFTRPVKLRARGLAAPLVLAPRVQIDPSLDNTGQPFKMRGVFLHHLDDHLGQLRGIPPLVGPRRNEDRGDGPSAARSEKFEKLLHLKGVTPPS